ncbi:MAG: AAA family ATPase, partial [Muribaculaceae bacterium]|nr:AAA family ATPase [Muribaculaceae bacterium]
MASSKNDKTKTNPESDIDLDNNEFQQVWQLINHTHRSVFLTGKAGTGKSTFLRYITENTKKPHVILAPTGVAAVNAGGVTLHSFFQLPLKPILPDDPDFSVSRIRQRFKYNRSKIQLIRKLKLIVIDEISMVRADVIDIVDRILRVYTGNMRLPFGGIQMLLVGDIFQLEPVATGDTREILRNAYNHLFFFSANVFKDFQVIPIELVKCYRQSDTDFVNILDRIRIGRPLPTDIQVINSRYNPDIKINHARDFIMTLCSQRDMVNAINESHLAQINFPEITYTGAIEGDFPESALPVPDKLVLKLGAQVVFVRNDFEHRWYNGSLGRVTMATSDKLEVELENGDRHILEPERWSNIKYVYNEDSRRVDEIELGSYIQYPVRLAWALTIHKSQGLTFNNVIIDLGRGAFTGGQTYVALSRCRSLEGMTLKSMLHERDIFINPEISRFSQTFNSSDNIKRALTEAQADDLYVKSARLWDKRQFMESTDLFFQAMEGKNRINDRGVKRLIKQKLSVFESLNNQISELESQLSQAKAKLRKLASEYVSLGLMGLQNQADLSPALLNFEKALQIDPENHDALRGKAQALVGIGENETALETYIKLIKTNSVNSDDYVGAADLYSSYGEIHDALDCLLKALTIDKNNPVIC